MMRLAVVFAALIAAAMPARAVDIEEITSPGGIDAWLVAEPSIPFTALEIRFKGGASLDRDGKRGAVNLMTGLLEEGAGDLDAQGFAKARQDLAASYGFNVYDDTLSISAQFLTENRDEAVALLKTALTEPRFDDSAIERVRGQVLSIIASDQKDPSYIAGARFDEMAFGDHPYGSDMNGTADSVAALTREDIVAAHGDVMARDRMFVGAVGDITGDELGTLIDDLLGDLPEVGADMPDEAEYLLSGGVTVVDFNTPQSVALFGHEGIRQDDPDFFAAYVLNQVLGDSGLTSRLMEEVREKRGLTYGIYSYLAVKDHAELYLGSVASSNDRIAEAIEVTRAEWADVAANGVTEDELARAKTYLTGAFPLRFDGNDTIASIMVGMQMDGRPTSYLDTRNGKIEAITMEDIKRVAARLLQPEDLHFVVVGQPEGLEPSN